MERYKCEKCGNVFENEGEVLDYNSPIYGPCSKKVADCRTIFMPGKLYRVKTNKKGMINSSLF